MNTKSELLRKSVLSVLIPLLSGFSAYAEQPGPMLVPDYNRDGMINTVDFERARAGEAFTIWLNDDDDAEGTEGGSEAGDTNTDLHDVPGGEGNDRDCDDDTVNGRCDLLDFFPVLVDLNGVEGSGDYTWKLISKSVNVVFTQLKAERAGDFHTKETKALNDETPLYEAEVEQLAGDDGKDEVSLPDGFLKEGRGVILVEGAALRDEGLTLRGTKDGSDPVEVTLDLRVVDVEKMYGWMNLRPEAAVSSKPPYQPPAVSQLSQPSQRHFILVHGYNTNHEEARGNAAEFYKKLWQSGSDAMFTAVEWRGDQSQVKFEQLGVNFTPNYYVNVENAFAAAKPFADACAKLPGEKILVAHSLGNMLVSSAIKDYGLDYTKYVMLNATVAREAFDASVTDTDMVDDDWLNLEEAPLLERASRWYENFADKKYDPYEYRRKLAWRGRFANLPRTVNYYSPTDNILVNPDPNEPDPDKVFNPNDPDIYRKVNELLVAKLVNGKSIGSGGRKKTGFGFWAFSEKMKGSWLLDVVNDVLTNMLEVAQTDAYKCEGGWGTNANYNAEATEFDPANTRFTPFLDPRMKAQGMLDILPAETERLRAQHLADAIPAESFAAGANPVATVENVNEESFIGENPDWPLYEGEEVRTNLWNHSAFREVAFYHTSKFYASLAAVGKPRVIIDTDLGSSMDDLWTIDFAARMHKQGKLDLMAVMMDRPDNSDEEGRGEFLKFADRYLASLGFANLPLGKSSNLAEDRLPQHVFNPYWTLIYSNNVTGVGALMPTNRTDDQLAALTNAVVLYRRLLNDAPEKSVVICSIGFLNNLKALMESGIDHEQDGIYSTGLELIAAKVKELRIMGGCFEPESAPSGGAEYNMAGDPVAAKKVIEEWPTPVVMSPWEVGLNLDYKADDVLADFPVGTPDPVIRAAYVYWPNPAGENEMNRPWDLATILPLTEGDTLIPLSEKGGISVDDKGVTTFTPNTSGNRCYQLASNMSTNEVLARFRAVFSTGNPSVTLPVSGKPEPGVDYNGSELVFKFMDFQFGGFAEEDLKFSFAVDGAEYAPESTEWDETLGVLSVRFAIPPDAVTAGNVYDGMLTVALENETLGSVQLTTADRQLVQGVLEGGRVNANLARIDGDGEYATIAEAVAEADGNPIRLLHAASWSPSMSDLGKSVRFLNKSWLHLDISGLPANVQTDWTDVDGNDGTLTLALTFADTVVYGTIRTAETDNPVAEAIAIKDGRYIYVGDEAGVASYIRDGVTQIVDHRGMGMVMPGCTDGHSHYTMKFGLDNMKGGVMFALEDDKTAVLQKVAAAVQEAEVAGKTSLFGFGWNFLALRQDPVSLKDLDDVTHGVSTIIFDQGGHHAFCNSECLRRCGIIDGEGHVLIDKIDGGLLELDDNGYPTGFADERVTGYLTRMGGIDADEIVDDEVAENTMRASQALLLSTGYTIAMEGWSNMLHPGKLYEAAHRMDTNGTLKLVFPMTYEVEPWQTNMTEQIDYLASLNGTYRTRHVLPEYLKIFMDGVVETRTGALSRPYRDGTDYKSFWPVDRLAEITADCNARGLTVHTHVMGDAAIKDATDAYIKGGDGTHRNCLVHLRNVRPEDFRRFADNNIACSAGFTWHVGNGEEADAQFAEFLDDEYIQHAYPMKSFFDAGVRVSSHSDFPANIPCPQDPFGIIQVAVTGQIVDPATGELIPPFDTNELITVEQAFQALTINGAWQVGLENERGSIKVGKWADFVLADRDVFECAATDIGKTRVVSTWFEGEKVYEAPESVPVTPGAPQGPFDRAVDATNAMMQAAFAPSEEVAAVLTTSAARTRYAGWFSLAVTSKGTSEWYVEAALTDAGKTNLAETAAEATRQIPVAAIAALEENATTNVTVTGCESGFYYSLYGGQGLTALPETGTVYGPELCNAEGKVEFPAVAKPSDAAGFFTIGVSATKGK